MLFFLALFDSRARLFHDLHDPLFAGTQINSTGSNTEIPGHFYFGNNRIVRTDHKYNTIL